MVWIEPDQYEFVLHMEGQAHYEERVMQWCSGVNPVFYLQQISQDLACKVRRDGVEEKQRQRNKLVARERASSGLVSTQVSGREPAQGLKNKEWVS